MKTAYAVVAVVVVAVACVTTNAAVMNKGLVHPSISADSVVLYRTPQEVPRPYDEVAILNSKGDADLTDESAMYNSMRKKAAQLGANGVIIENTKDPGTGAKVAKALLGTSANRKGEAVAIYVHPDTTMVSKK